MKIYRQLSFLDAQYERCRDCGRTYKMVWLASDELWMKIWGGENGLLCPDCFTERCDKLGIFIKWIPSE